MILGLREVNPRSARLNLQGTDFPGGLTVFIPSKKY